MWTYLIDVNLRKAAKKTRVEKRLDYVLNWFCSNHSRHRNNIIGRTYVIIYCSKEFDKEQNSCEPCKSRRKMTVTMFHINSSSHISCVFCILWEVGVNSRVESIHLRHVYTLVIDDIVWMIALDILCTWNFVWPPTILCLSLQDYNALCNHTIYTYYYIWAESLCV